MEVFLRLSKSTNYRFLMFSKLLTRGFSFQFYFLLWEFNIAFSHFWEFFCSRHVNQDVVLKNCLYCSLEKYYFQSLLNGVFINKKRQPSNFRMLDKTEKEPVYSVTTERLYMGEMLFVVPANWATCDLRPVTPDLWPATCGLDPPSKTVTRSMVVIEKKLVWCGTGEFETVHSKISTLYTEWMES